MTSVNPSVQGGIPVVFQPTSVRGQRRPPIQNVLNAATIKGLGFAQTFCGSIMFICELVALILASSTTNFSFHMFGSGLWCGPLVIICGILGCCYASSKKGSLAIAFLVFNVFSVTFFSLTPLGMMVIEIAIKPWYSRYYKEMMAMSMIMLVDAVAIIIIGFWSIIVVSIAIHQSDLCKRCCDKESSVVQQQQPIVAYLPQQPGSMAAPSMSQQIQFGMQAPAAPQSQIPMLYVMGYANGASFPYPANVDYKWYTPPPAPPAYS